MFVTWGYRFRNSLMDKTDPRARWIFSLCFLFSIVQFWDIRFLLVFFALAAVWYAISRVTFHETRRAWTFVFFLMSMMIIVNTIITSGGAAGVVVGPGHPVFELNFQIPLVHREVSFVLTIERLWFALTQVVRILPISGIFLIIPFTMDPRLYGFTFKGLGFPDRFAFSMDLAFRYVPTLARDFSATLDAQKARGYEIERVEGGLITQVRRVAPLIIPVTMSSILGGEDMINAMDLRCFGLRARTWVYTTSYHWFDYLLIVFSVVMLVTSVVLSILGYGRFWVPPALIS